MHHPENTTDSEMSPATKSEIKDILTDFLNKCGIEYPHDAILDESYNAACYAEAIRRGYKLNKALDVGICMGACYLYLENESARVFAGLYTALLVNIDDDYEAYADGLQEFLDRFTHRQPQKYKLLDDIVDLLHEAHDHWGTIAANLIVTTTVDYLTSMIIDNDVIEGMEIQEAKAPGFPQFTRRMTGASRAYSIMAFPPDLNMRSWIQVVPDLMHWIDHINDIFSFFKEELEGETFNYVSLSARSNGLTRVEALRKLANETADSYNRGLDLLRSCPRAMEAYKLFGIGYITFHKLSIRYKLDELLL